jgi:hypothetical protein
MNRSRRIVRAPVPPPVPPARSLANGTPHPVPAMTAYGWVVQGGFYVRPAKTRTTGRSR